MKLTQKQVVLDHLKKAWIYYKYGSITSMEAIEKYRITRLSDRIFNLRNQGEKISTTLKTVKTQYGKEEIAVYSLEQ